mmetsp:Transcript_56945/g.185042  ORF Transcript_56945/g.185042 Transcript_56945/m.185042 type:complete len:260 (-) Transcript_56945:1594-2373(-)
MILSDALLYTPPELRLGVPVLPQAPSQEPELNQRETARGFGLRLHWAEEEEVHQSEEDLEVCRRSRTIQTCCVSIHTRRARLHSTAVQAFLQRLHREPTNPQHHRHHGASLSLATQRRPAEHAACGDVLGEATPAPGADDDLSVEEVGGLQEYSHAILENDLFTHGVSLPRDRRLYLQGCAALRLRDTGRIHNTHNLCEAGRSATSRGQPPLGDFLEFATQPGVDIVFVLWPRLQVLLLYRLQQVRNLFAVWQIHSRAW